MRVNNNVKHWHANETEAEDSGPNVAVQSGKSEADDSNINVQPKRETIRSFSLSKPSPISYYLTPTRTIERPMEHW